ncbi:RNA polymerase II transcription elongation factor Elongin/SIII, subunit elongin C [Trachipleistophora hominis]|uniref:Elongin-C n=1 Tax=Trachipleistophora hominis TaxID=72359 RepID=L7JZP5_TRAHO|nr:RNA polymerase II transcription elongation factor Elongin/SIII, subunit elongin C [Trachipleistophora hominis]
MSEIVTLISSDNKKYEIPEHIANESKTLRVFFDSNRPFIEAIERKVVLPMNSKLLIRAIEYMKYKYQYRGKKAHEAPEFHITDEEALDLLDASVYLKI